MLRVLVDVILPVIAVAVMGGAIGRRIGLDLQTLQRATFFLFSPALVFVGLMSTEVDGGAVVRLAGVSIAVFVANAVVSFVWSRARAHDAPTRAAMALSSSVPNQGNMGLPVTRLAFGAGGLEVATLLFTISVVMNATCAVTMGTLAVGQHTRRRQVLFSAFRYPTVYAAIAGAIVNVADIRLPVVVDESTSTLAQAAIPMMLVTLGMSFRLPRRGDLTDPLGASVNRLLLGPLVAWGAALALGLDGLTRDVTIVMAAMPSAVNTTILAAQLRADVDLSVRIVVITTALSTLSLTALISFI